MANAELIKTIKTGLNSPEFKQKFIDIIKDEQTFNKEVAFALMAIQQSELLQKCSSATIIRSVFQVATTGLSLNPVLKFAALIPRYTSGGYECSLMPMYQGLCKLVTDSGSATSIRTHIVYEGDDFSIELGDEYGIKHSPKFKTNIPIIVYSIARLHDNSKIIEYMSWDEVMKIREYSESYRGYKAGRLKAEHCIWIQHESEMARKTVLKRLIKYVPKTDRFKVIHKALEIDQLEYPADMGKVGYLETLINSSTFDTTQRDSFIKKLEGISNAEADSMIDIMKLNQVPVDKDLLKRIQKPEIEEKNSDRLITDINDDPF